MAALSSLMAQDVETTGLSPLQFEKTSHNFGIIAQNIPVSHTFRVTNSGDFRVVINDISTPCGCTTPVYEQGLQLNPGESSEITLTYNAQAIGAFIKTATVTYNKDQTVSLTLTGEVIPGD
ncbi:DUF1573 domain-containing protein [Flavobacteriaceae bacterium M23B6Z8]